MIRITTVPENLSVKAEGHAGFGKKGQDIVCAAVSILLYAYAAEMVRIGGGTEIIDSGDTFEIRPADSSEDTITAYETVMGGLKLLADDYEKYVTLEVKT